MFSELIREKKLIHNLNYVKKDKKKFRNTRLIYGIAMMLISAMIVIYFGNLIHLYIPIIAFLIGYKMPYYSLLTYKDKNDKINSYLFPEFLQSFVALIPSSGNVYQTLVATVRYTRDPLKLELEYLISKIEDENNRDDYLEFAEYVGTSESYMIMDMIYQFSEFGIKKDSLEEMERFIQELQKNKVDEMIEKKMASMEMLGFTPIFISLFSVVGFAGVIFAHYMKDVMSSITSF